MYSLVVVLFLLSLAGVGLYLGSPIITASFGGLVLYVVISRLVIDHF